MIRRGGSGGEGLLTVAKFIYLLYTILIFFGSLMSGWFLLK
jgi:hypothetical protein